MANQTNYFWGTLILDALKLFYDKDSNLSANAMKVFFYLCDSIVVDKTRKYSEIEDIEEPDRSPVTQAQISEDLEIDKANVSRLIKELRNKQLIAKARLGFYVNPHIFYIGKARDNERISVRNGFDKIVAEQQGFVRFYFDESNRTLIDRLKEIEK